MTGLEHSKLFSVSNASISLRPNLNFVSAFINCVSGRATYLSIDFRKNPVSSRKLCTAFSFVRFGKFFTALLFASEGFISPPPILHPRNNIVLFKNLHFSKLTSKPWSSAILNTCLSLAIFVSTSLTAIRTSSRDSCTIPFRCASWKMLFMYRWNMAGGAQQYSYCPSGVTKAMYFLLFSSISTW